MSRTALKKDDIVSSKNCKYIIQSVIGDGATGIVYDAIYYDDINQKHNVRLKECYPYGASIRREAEILIWDNPLEKEECVNKFIDSYFKLMKRQNSNFIVHAFNLFEANGTMYILMDSNDGFTFDNDQINSLSDILKTVKLLAHVVGEYHNNGYLHLDIKPNNFLVYPRPSEHIVLFDVDSITLIEDIKTGTVKCVSYSKGWASPEQMQGRIDKLCPATDIYSIGAVLFEKIMGRAVNNDDIGIFADWNFEGDLFNNVNPKIKRMLKGIFHKTLSANIKRRYQTCDEVINDLNEIISIIVCGEPYIISNVNTPYSGFIGRERELEEISKLFNSKIKTVFIRGESGIGKSELAKKYVSVYLNEYDAITFINYKDSLEDSIKRIQIANYEGIITIDLLKKICSKNKVLFVVDNFNVSVDKEPLLEELLEINCNFIFTTNTDFSDCLSDNSKQIEILSLPIDEVLSLFVAEAKLKYISKEEREAINTLLKEIKYHTMIATMLARQVEKSGITVKELLSQYKGTLDSILREEKIVLRKDNKVKKTTPLQMLRAIFQEWDLSQEQKDILELLYLFDFEKLTKDKIRELSNFNDCINCLNDLKELGYVKENEILFQPSEYTVNTLTTEMVKIEIIPDLEKSSLLTYQIDMHTPQEFVEDTLDDIYYDDAVENRKALVKCEYLSALFYSLLKKGHVDFVAKKLSQILNGNFWTLEFFDIYESSFFNGYFYKLKPILKDFAKDSSLKLETQFYLTNILEMLAIDETRWLRKKDEEIEGIKALKYLISLFYKGMDIIDRIETSDKTSLLWLLSKPMIQRIKDYVYDYQYDYFKPVVESIQKVEHLFNIEDYYWDKAYNNKKRNEYDEWYGTITKRKTIDEEDEAEYQEEYNQFKLARDWLEEINEMFWNGEDVKTISDYIQQQDIPLWKKIESYWNIASDFYLWKLRQSGNMGTVRKNIANLPWQRLLDLLNYEEQFWLNHDVKENAFDDYHYDCDAYRALCYAYLEGRSNNFNEYMQEIIETLKSEFEWANKRNSSLWFYDFDDIRLFHPARCVAEVFDGLRMIEKQHLAFPYLIECVKIVENGVDENMLPWYKTIVEFASNAYFAPDEEQDKLFDIEMEYQNKIDKIVPPNNLKPISDDD